MSKPFADVVRDYRNGLLHEKLSSELAELTRAVVETGSKGEYTVKFALKADSGQVKMSVETKSKTPQRLTVGDAIFFTDDDGGLHRTDPRQGELSIVRDTKTGAH